MLSHPLLPKLRQLKRSDILDTRETRAAPATRDQLSPTECLAILLDDELQRRDQAKLARRVAASGVDPAKTLAHCDFSAGPGLHPTLVADLATAAFVVRAQHIILAGPTGVGKSYWLNARVVAALKRDSTALQRPTSRILLDLQAARADGSSRQRLRRLCTVDLLALDDVGLRPLSPELADDLDALVRARYERKALILTSHRALDAWPEAFANPLLASAARDHLTHPCHTLLIRGQSYRQRGRRKEHLTNHLASEPPTDGSTLDPWPTPR
jgi:DNA replication protein DnaC